MFSVRNITSRPTKLTCARPPLRRVAHPPRCSGCGRVGESCLGRPREGAGANTASVVHMAILRCNRLGAYILVMEKMILRATCQLSCGDYLGKRIAVQRLTVAITHVCIAGAPAHGWTCWCNLCCSSHRGTCLANRLNQLISCCAPFLRCCSIALILLRGHARKPKANQIHERAAASLRELAPRAKRASLKNTGLGANWAFGRPASSFAEIRL